MKLSPRRLIKAVSEARDIRRLPAELADRSGLKWRRSSPCDTGLYDAGQAQIGHHLYVFGGFETLASVSNQLRVFDLATETWLPNRPTPPGLAQSHCAIATDGQRFIYCASGQLGPQCNPAIRDVFVFDSKTGIWTNLPLLPEARYAGTMQLWRGRLHFVGGAREDRWTPASDHWSLGVGDGATSEREWRVEKPIPVPGMHRGSIIFDDAWYVFGGQQGDFVAIPGDPDCRCTGRTQETYISSCLRVEEPAGEWITLADLPIPASHTDFSLVAYGGRLLLVGGQIHKHPDTFELRLTDAIQAYDPRSDQWSLAGHLPFRLKIPLIGVFNDTIYVIGGQRGAGLGDRPGAVVADVWAASLEDLRKAVLKPRPTPLTGRSVLLLTHDLTVSGAPLLLLEAAEQLIAAGVSVRLASLGDDTGGWTLAARKQIPVVPVETAIRHALSSDLVIANTVAPSMMSWCTEALQSHPKLAKKLVCWVHEIDVEHYRPGGDLIHMAALTIFDSRACKEAWIDELGPLPNAAVIHPFVNRDILDAVAQEHLPFSRDPNRRSANADGPAPRAAIRAALGVNEDDFLVLSLASVEPRKGQKLLQQTVARLAAETGLPVKLLLVGFRNWRRRMKWFLRMNAREWAVLPPRRAYVWQTEIAAFYRAADAFVTNSQGRGALRGECFGRVTVEAMAAGAIALGTDAGGTSEIIVDGESGFLYPAGKEGQQVLAMRLKELIEDPALARRVAESGRRRALSSFSEERFFGEFSERLSGLLKA
jgi:glycosyltransferase involved in cell wall biosynthesis